MIIIQIIDNNTVVVTTSDELKQVLSEDNDYVPVVKRVKELYPEKEIIICPPPQKNYYVHNLLSVSGEDSFYRFKWNQIKHFQFPDEYYDLVNLETSKPDFLRNSIADSSVKSCCFIGGLGFLNDS